MATTNPDVIEEQPQVQCSSSFSEQQLDEDGEEILIEGKCYKRGLMLAALQFYTCTHSNDALNLICCIGAPVVLPMGIYNGWRSSKIWQLYLTRTSIFYTKVNPVCVCCDTTTVEIPLSQIEDIRVYTETDGFLTCCSGIKIAYTTTILVEFKLTAAESKPWHCCCTIEPLIQIVCCENSTEFVDAVRRQMETVVTQ